MKKTRKLLMGILCLAMCTLALPTFAQAEVETLTLYVGQQIELKPYLLSDDSYKAGTATWKSYQTDLASVNSAGVVKALKQGEVVIGATFGSGNSIKEARVKLIVKTAVEKVDLNETEIRITAGEEQVLTAKITPADGLPAPYLNGVNWKSADTKIATVDATGRVKGVTAGKVKILASSKDSDKRAYCDVEVYNAVESIQIVPQTYTLDIGEGIQLVPIVLPESAPVKTVTYKTGNVKVADVSKTGYVTAKGSGETLIYATTVDGLRALAVSIKVNSMVTGVQLDKTYLELDEVNNSYRLQATLVPKDANQPPKEVGIKWKSSNTTVVSVGTDGLVKALKPGQVSITATSVDGEYVVACTVKSLVQTNNASLGYSQIKIAEPPKVMYAGQSMAVDFDALPENANNRKIGVKSNPSSGMGVSIKDGKVILTPTLLGLYRVTVYSDSASAEFSVEVKPSITNLALKAPVLTAIGDGYTCYLGQNFEVQAAIDIGGIELSELAVKKIKWEYPNKDLKVVQDPVDPLKANVTLLRPVNTYLEASMLDQSIKHRITLNYEPMAQSITMAEQADINLNYLFKPTFELKAKETLRYGYTDVISKTYELSLEEVYIDTQFLQSEIEFENKNIPELKALADKLGDGAQRNTLLDEWGKHIQRKNSFENMLKQPSAEYQRITSLKELTDRSLKKLVFFELKEGGIRSEYSGKALMKVVSQDGNLEKKMWVFVKNQEEDLILLDQNGKVIATSSEVAKQKAIEKEAAAKKQYFDGLKAKFKETPPSALPSDAFLESTWNALESKLIVETQFKGAYQRKATHSELLALLVQSYSLETKKTPKKITDRYFSNVQNDAAERAYQLGFISGNSARIYNGTQTVDSKMLKELISKWLKATKTNLKGTITLDSLIGSQTSYTNEELIQKILLVMKSN